MSYREILGWKDVFAQLGFTTWWESFRSYTLIIISASTLFYVYSSSSGHVVCLPSDNGTAMFINFGSAEAAFTDLRCISFLPLGSFLTNFWWISLVATASIFLANNFWEYATPLVAAINDLKSFYDNILKEERKCQIHDLLDYKLVGKPLLPADEPQSTSRSVSEQQNYSKHTESRKLWKAFLQQERSHFGSWYRARNVISLFVSAMYAIAMAVLVMLLLIQMQPEFDCVVNNTSFVCIYPQQNVILPVVVTHMVMSSVQCLIFLVVLCKYGKLGNIKLFLRIMNHSGISKSENHEEFKTIVEEIKDNKKNLKKAIKDEIKNFQTITSENEEYFHIYKLTGGQLEDVFKELESRFAVNIDKLRVQEKDDFCFSNV